MDKKSLITIRPWSKRGDYNFVMATWLRGLYYGNEWFREIDKDVYMKKYHLIIDSILDRRTARIDVSCLIEDPDVVLGYSVTEGSSIHWVFVKHAWRRIGIARDLVSKDLKTATHLTRVGKLIKPENMEFNPFLI